MRSSSPASPEFKSNPEVKVQPVQESNKRKQIIDQITEMDRCIEDGNIFVERYRYLDAVEHYQDALEYCPVGHPAKAEICRRIGLSFKELGMQDKDLSLFHEPLSKDYEDNRKGSARNFKQAIRYLKQALDEDKKNKKNIGEITDHFELAKIYITRNKFRKACQYILAGMELNLARKPEHKCMLDAKDKEGYALLQDFLSKVPQKRWAIPYYEQAIMMLKKSQAKYPNSGFEDAMESAEIKLGALKILPPDDAPERPCRVVFSRKNSNADRFVKTGIGSALFKGSMFSIKLGLADKMILEEPVAKKQNTSSIPSVPSCRN